MVEVGDKAPTKRIATAAGKILIIPLAYDLVKRSYPSEEDQGKHLYPEQPAPNKARRKGDTLTIAQLAATMGAKQTPTLIPLCHPLSPTKIDVNLKPLMQEGPGVGGVRYYIQSLTTALLKGNRGRNGGPDRGVRRVAAVWDVLKAVAGR